MSTNLASAAAQLETLLAEQAEIPARLEAARRAGDPAAVLVAEVRGGDLPGLIQAARLPLLPLQIEAGWANAERLAAADRAAAGELVAARARVDRLRKPTWDLSAMAAAELNLEVVKAAEDASVADIRDRAAEAATRRALFAVEALEAELTELTGDPAVEGEGPLRARPQPLAGTVLIGDSGPLAPLIEHLEGVEGFCRSSGMTGGVVVGHFLVGSVLPRWTTYRMDPEVFADPAIRQRAVEKADEERARIREKELAAAECGVGIRRATRSRNASPLLAAMEDRNA